MTAYAGPYRDPTEVLGRRFGAAVIDGLLGLVVALAIGIPLMFAVLDGQTRANDFEAERICDRINGTTNGEPSSTSSGESSQLCIPVGDTTYILDGGDFLAIYGGFFLTSLVARALNTVVLQGLKGGTVGKLAVGLRVVRDDGRYPGLGKAALRTLVGIADGQCFIGPIMVLVTKGHRRLADMAAGTFVVDKDDANKGPIIVPGLNAPMWGGPAYGYGYGPPPGWGPGYGAPPPQPGHGYGPPPPGSGHGYPVPPAAPAQAPAAPSADGPHWDAERDTYIQYDRDRSAWLQWDEARRGWKPIDT